MLIDWFTVGAQFVNFIVLVLLLKKLFYRPILNAMSAREERIANALRDAAEKRAAAEQRLHEIQEKEQEIERNRSELLQRAAADAEGCRLKLVSAAKDDVAAMRHRWLEAQQREQERIEHGLAITMESELLALAQAVLRDLAGTRLEREVANKFVAELRALSSPEKARLRSDANVPVVIRSSIEIDLPTRSELQKAVEQEFGVRTVRFETAPDLVCGIELATAGHKISWNVQDWLHSIEHSLQKAFGNTATHARI